MRDRMQAPTSPRASAPRIVRTLEAVVAAGRPETARGGAGLAQRLETLRELLTHQLEAHLATQRILCVHVTSAGLRADGMPVRRRAARQTLAAALLRAGSVVGLVFKQGVPREEILRLIGVLHRAPLGVDGAESIATMLWQSDLRHIAFRCQDDFYFDRERGCEQFDFVNAALPHADELAADTTLEAVHSSAKDGEAFSDLDLDASASPLRRVFLEEPGAAERLTTGFPSTSRTLARLAELLTGIQLGDESAGTKTLAREALLRVVDLQLQGQQLDCVRDVLRRLRPAAAHPAVHATLRGLGARICGPAHVALLAAALADGQSLRPPAAVVHDILRLLGDDGVQPLWQLLATVADPAAHAQAVEVLAGLCADDPQTLTQYVNSDSWEAVRDGASVLGRIGGARVLAHLGRWRRHPDARARLEVVRALLTNEQPSATTMLCDFLDDEEQRVRQSALWVLAARRDARALPKLRQTILEMPGFRERAAAERDDFFRALGRLADEDTLRLLAAMLDRRVWPGKGWQAELRRGAAIALGESSWTQGRRLLDKHAHSRDGRVRDACRSALRGIRDTPPVEETNHVG